MELEADSDPRVVVNSCVSEGEGRTDQMRDAGRVPGRETKAAIARDGIDVQATSSRKRKANELYQPFDSMNLHHVDCYSIRDTRPEPETIKAIIANWEKINRRKLKKLRKKPRNHKNKVTTSKLKSTLVEQLVTYLNQYFKKSTRMSEPIIVVSLIKVLDDDSREWQHDAMSPKAFEFSYNFLNAPIDGVECKIAKMWLDHSHSELFDQLTFEPLPEGMRRKRQRHDDYNMWTGFKIPLSDGERYLQRNGRDACMQQLRPFFEHIMHVWCRGDAVLYDYVVNWMAWTVQKPNEKIGVAIAIRGDKGSGKGVIVQTLGKIFGKAYFFHAQRAEDLVSNFNDHLQTCLLCFVDEVTFASDVTATNILKTMITEESTNVHTKFRSKFTLRSFMNLILAGNLSKIVECSGNERKYLILVTNDKWSGGQTSQSKQYFQRILATPPQILRYFLSHRNIPDFNPRKVPSSQATRDQKVLSLPSLHSWLHCCLVRGRILDLMPVSLSPAVNAREPGELTEEEQLAADWEVAIQKSHIYPAFLQYCKDSNCKSVEENIFWKELMAVFRPRGAKDSQIQQVRRRVGSSSAEGDRNGSGGKRSSTQQCMITFPSLEHSRQLFRENVVHEDTWSFQMEGEIVTQDENTQYTDAQLGLQQVFT